jgi:hypothetical protein
MSELTEQLWAVLSERGCEASSLTYAQALELMRSLLQEKVSGLSIITDAAARRALPNKDSRPRQPKASGAGRQLKGKS